MTQQISISDMYKAISSLDSEGVFRQVSYNLTAHNALEKDAWWVFIPYGQWSVYPAAPNPSPFESAVLQAIPTASAGECFIDIMHLSGASKNFFVDPAAKKKIVDLLAGFINALPTNVTPIVRYLQGDPKSTPDPSQSGIVHALFDGNPIKHPNAWFYYGSFNPGLQFVTGKPEDTIEENRQRLEAKARKLWERLVDEIKKHSDEFYQEVKKIEPEITSWIARFIEQVLIEPVSWNHGKMFAVNGKNLVTAGGNYWDDYITGRTWLFDMGMSITGDAAIDAHQFANYLWRYLGTIPATDKYSRSMGNLLTNPISQFKDAKAPIYSNFPQNGGSIAALSVGKNGNWPSQTLGFPAQIFDAVRDFILNVLAVIAEKYFSQQLDLVAFFAKTLSDDNPDFRALLKDAGINPAAWASRYAKNYAVSRAQSSVRFNQQKFVMDDLAHGSPAYMQLVAEINKYAHVKWKGYIWPYDLMMALGYALSNISNNNSAAGAGVEIVASCPSAAQGGYQDPVTAAEFTTKLTEVMGGMQALQYIKPKGAITDIISKHFAYKRIDTSTTNPAHGNHSKMVLVDDLVCYIGSDNAYPSYNEEFGIWIDDAPSIQSLIDQYWNGLWTFAKPAA